MFQIPEPGADAARLQHMYPPIGNTGLQPMYPPVEFSFAPQLTRPSHSMFGRTLVHSSSYDDDGDDNNESPVSAVCD